VLHIKDQPFLFPKHKRLAIMSCGVYDFFVFMNLFGNQYSNNKKIAKNPSQSFPVFLLLLKLVIC